MELIQYMKMAREEAMISLREGNKGLGAIIVKGDQGVSLAHNTENTQNAPFYQVL